jgi:GH25 family lysozyme M1 (1,4-beta-N-acetylmuramidase)
MTLRGIDSSRWQAGLPDATINADFIIFKATEGVGYTDPDCNPSYQEAKAAGKLLGVYHFARPDGNDPISEADWFLSQTKGYIGEALLALDWETEPKSNVAWAKSWLDRVYSKTGIRPLIYMSSSVVNSYDWSSVYNAGYALWVAQYRDNNIDINYDMSNAGAMPDVNWVNGYAMWQWTSKGRLTGYSGDLDCNIFYGDKAAWTAFATGHPATKPAPVTAPIAPTPVVVPPVVAPAPKPVVEPVSTPQDSPLDKENNSLLKQILALLQSLVTKVTNIFK